MLLTEEEAEFLDKLTTCPRCWSKAVEILPKKGDKNAYIRKCLKCGYEEELKGVSWNE